MDTEETHPDKANTTVWMCVPFTRQRLTMRWVQKWKSKDRNNKQSITRCEDDERFKREMKQWKNGTVHVRRSVFFLLLSLFTFYFDFIWKLPKIIYRVFVFDCLFSSVPSMIMDAVETMADARLAHHQYVCIENIWDRDGEMKRRSAHKMEAMFGSFLHGTDNLLSPNENKSIINWIDVTEKVNK